jgi:hypothetical protein
VGLYIMLMTETSTMQWQCSIFGKMEKDR